MVNTLQRSYEMHLKDTLRYEGPIYLEKIDERKIRQVLNQKARAQYLCSGISEPSARVLAEALGLDASVVGVTDIKGGFQLDFDNIERKLKGEEVIERPIDRLCLTASYLLRTISKYERSAHI